MRIVNPTAVLGENLAVEYLKKKGYKIVERNFRKRNGEIDIIAIDPSPILQNSPQHYPIRSRQALTNSGSMTKGIEGTVVFVEVKTRKSSQFGTPLEAITPWKLRELIRTSELFMLIHPQLPKAMRIDAISIMLNNNNEIDTIEHVENIST